MACNGSSGAHAHSTTDGASVGRCMALVGVLILVLVGNVIFLIRTKSKTTKWQPMMWMLRVIAVLGLANGILNSTTYLITMLSGGWVLGTGCCQLYGAAACVLVSSYTWLLALAALERYKRVCVASEHVSLFSEVNTRILVWGVILLITVLFLAPVYGWGEYSTYRGSFDFLLSANSSSAVTMTTAHSVPAQFSSLVVHSARSPNSLATQIITVLQRAGHVTARRPVMHRAGVLFPLRAQQSASLACFVRDLESESLDQELTDLINSNGTQEKLKVDGLHLNIEVPSQLLQRYEHVYLRHQVFTSCGLDYSPVNDNIYTFVALAWLCVIVLPVAVTIVCYIRVFCTSPCGGSSGGFHDYAPDTTPDDLHMSRVIAWATAAYYVCLLPHYVISLVSGMGTAISGDVHFMGTILLHGSWCLLPVMHLASSDLREECHCACAGSTASPECSSPGEYSYSDPGGVVEINPYLRHAPGMRTEQADVKTRLLSAPHNSSKKQTTMTSINDKTIVHVTSNLDAEDETVL